MAYALYCKLDENNRPIAGVVNFCPDHLKDDVYDEDKFILVSGNLQQQSNIVEICYSD